MDAVTISRNLILRPPTPIASGTISFATGATAATVASATIAMPVCPVSKYIVATRNNATQTTIAMQVNNTRQFGSTSVPFDLGSATFNTGDTKDTLVEGMFAAGASGAMLRFTLGSAATAAEVVSADYEIWPVR
ncbi:MAG: hypothetical protein PHE17_21620 [Thiothrix sp.]|uniref:hypothetical protein n=1 Tax=Thiothrix sp. TaxID=1032 RepID=UPI0026372864|nr:hypothetical protein [Thiothrix sp.]MDD5395629.1 hypothetical protein [Thiothrix sp.]